MSLIVGLSGTHGTGKSTILKGIKDFGYTISEAQIARSAQKTLGWETLAGALEKLDTMWALQEAILLAMKERDESIINSKIVTLVERTPADMWAYTKEWCSRLGVDVETDKRAKDYQQRCLEITKNYGAFIIVPISDVIPFVEEPRRADLASRLPVRDTINEFLNKTSAIVYEIHGTSPKDRVLESARVIFDLIQRV